MIGDRQETSPIPLVTADLMWRERCTELQADRDYWRSRAESWEARYVDASTQLAMLAGKIVDTPTEQADAIPPAIEVALQQATIGMPNDVARTMRREVLATYAKSKGEEDVRVTTALKRLHEGDGQRLAAFLGEERD